MNNNDIEVIKKELIDAFPDFINKIQPDLMQSYMLFGDFGLYIRDGINNNYLSEPEVDKIFTFLNKMGSSMDKDVHNLLTVGVLEILTDDKKTSNIAKKKLVNGALDDFILIEKFWYD